MQHRAEVAHLDAQARVLPRGPRAQRLVARARRAHDARRGARARSAVAAELGRDAQDARAVAGLVRPGEAVGEAFQERREVGERD